MNNHLIHIQNDDLHAAINPFGAELTELNLLNKENVLWQKETSHWNRVAPNLFPIVGRLKNDSFEHESKIFHIGQHGFARDCVFEREKQSADSVTFLLKSTPETFVKYPFEFEFRVIYELDQKFLKIHYQTKNLSEETMHYSAGGHPAFHVAGLENYSLSIPGNYSLLRHVLDGSYISGETEAIDFPGALRLKENLFERDAMVFLHPPFSMISLEHNTKGPVLTMQSDNWEALGIWTKQGAPFICIEPWWGYADKTTANGKISEKAGIHHLASGATEIFSYQIILH